MKYILVSLALIILLLTSCDGSPTSMTNNIILATPSLFPASPKTPIPTPIETISAAFHASSSSLLNRCLTVETNSPASSLSTGALILSSTKDIGNGLVRYTAYGINMATNEKVELSKPGENALHVSISPDGRWMAYEKYVLINKSDNLIIVDSLGKQQKA